MPPIELKLFLSYLTMHTEKWTDSFPLFFHFYPPIYPFIDPSIHLPICHFFLLSYVTLCTQDYVLFYCFPLAFFLPTISNIHSIHIRCYFFLNIKKTKLPYAFYPFILINLSTHPHFTTLVFQTINKEVSPVFFLYLLNFCL